jgi:hypothetical protein
MLRPTAIFDPGGMRQALLPLRDLSPMPGFRDTRFAAVDPGVEHC